MVTMNEQQAQQSREIRTIEDWFKQLEINEVSSNLWDIQEPLIHLRNERLTWGDPEHNRSSGPTLQNGVLKIDYFPINYYLVPASLTAFLSNFALMQIHAASVLKIIFKGLRSVLGEETMLTVQLEYVDPFGNLQLMTLASGDSPKVIETDNQDE